LKDLSIYIHIPFCDHKCIYCDFYSIIRDDDKDKFISSLKKEIQHYSPRYGGSEIKSIFFGGGTPSMLSPLQIGEIIDSIKNNYNCSPDIEITVETNPGTVDSEKLNGFKSFGVNRLSVGVQTFDNEELKFLTRIHDAQTARSTVRAAFEAGIENVSLDLIFNLPGQTSEKWLVNLHEAVELPIKHISAYSLILERGTILNKMVLDKKVKLKDSDYDADLYETTIEFLTSKGFCQYEVSSFSLRGYECVHNLAYWRYQNYLGFGPSAHSFYDNKRWWNYSPLNYYLRNIAEYGSAVRSEEYLTYVEQLEEYVMLALRSNGLDLGDLHNKFGLNWYYSNEVMIYSFLKDGYLVKSDNFLKFTNKGYSLCDEILLKFEYQLTEKL